MPDRLDWEKARKRQVVSARGGDPTEVTRFRAVAASDADVQKLQKLGYSGKRPATTSEVRELIKTWAPTELGVSRREIDEVRKTKGAKQQTAAAALAEKLAHGYKLRLRAIDGSTAMMKPGTPARLRRQATRSYEVLAEELGALAKGRAVARQNAVSEPSPRVQRASSHLGPTEQELATLRALPVRLQQARAEILWKRVEAKYESKRDAAMGSRSTRSRQSRLRVLFLESQAAKRAIFDDNGLNALD